MCVRCDLAFEFLVLFFFFFFFGGKGGKCFMHCNAKGAVCGTLHQGMLLGLFACWTSCPVFYPLKPTPAADLATSLCL